MGNIDAFRKLKGRYEARVRTAYVYFQLVTGLLTSLFLWRLHTLLILIKSPQFQIIVLYIEEHHVQRMVI